MSPDQHPPLCPRTRKRSFACEQDASERLWEIRELKATPKVPSRTYRCPYCPYWHLTGNEIRVELPRHRPRRSKKNRRSR